MCDTTDAQSPNDSFISAKTATAIPVRHPALRDALIQASLDPQVRSIDYVASAQVASAQVALDAVVLQREDGRYVLDIVPARRTVDLDEGGLVLIAWDELKLEPLELTLEEIRREPRRSNANLVWAYSGVAVPVGLRLRIQQVLLEEGPMALGQLLKSLDGEGDAAVAVMALACANLVCLDLFSQPLSPTTLVRLCVQAERA
ncbi:hypothetical protein BRDID11004_22990 [Bradyrhizobium diazoefficiens]|uniref:Uncharacterized protein n=1 Tax=Bradyrhizobium diazoefficiens TaxID=1355477 RepID=A0A810AUR6_9BRAD|nr:hypothetical protein F07S3_66250 [Bradyrhizobium diazoefficiens]BCA14477.1 hypothetical protein BDHF08_63240 [Bradyrhizobium diazoefficiens]BCE58887.1 hypothetical protein XF5B_63990 [Bradyrhizobium diazoefficiens]BCE67566.1 hypothetical protein XF6B_63650 [Bradyrhizobium diazoefficiens]